MVFINEREEQSDHIAREANSAQTLSAMALEVSEIERWGSPTDSEVFESRMSGHFVGALNRNLENAISLHEKTKTRVT